MYLLISIHVVVHIYIYMYIIYIYMWRNIVFVCMYVLTPGMPNISWLLYLNMCGVIAQKAVWAYRN